MLLHFYKMNGAGNDFIVVDNRNLDIPLDEDTIAALCDRHRGIGADGLLAVEPAEQGADYRFRYYNADGGEAEMCGNGARCFARFANVLSGGDRDRISFETPAGIIAATFHGSNVRLAMSDPHSLRMYVKIEIQGVMHTVHVVNTGVPHAVVPVEDLSAVTVRETGAALRYHSEFQPKGTNVNFMQVKSPGSIAIRTYERGVEDETLACGTGMVACALIYHELTGEPSPISVLVKGGDTLKVGFEEPDKSEYTNVTLFGPADFVFQGTVQL